MTLFERTKEIAKKRKISLLTLNDRAGLGTNAIYKWKGTNPSLTAVQKVAEVLNVSTDYLLGNTDDMFSNLKETPKADLKEVANNDSWDEWLSADGQPLSDHDKAILRAMFGGDDE